MELGGNGKLPFPPSSTPFSAVRLHRPPVVSRFSSYFDHKSFSSKLTKWTSEPSVVYIRIYRFRNSSVQGYTTPLMSGFTGSREFALKCRFQSRLVRSWQNERRNRRLYIRIYCFRKSSVQGYTTPLRRLICMFEPHAIYLDRCIARFLPVGPICRPGLPVWVFAVRILEFKRQRFRIAATTWHCSGCCSSLAHLIFRTRL